MIKEIETKNANNYSSWLDINKRVERVGGLSVRKIANVINNSLMLVENPDDIHYNTTARLYEQFSKDLTSTQKMKLSSLLSEYAEDDEESMKRLRDLSRFKRAKYYDCVDIEEINTEDDLAADVMASVMYNTATADAYYSTGLKLSRDRGIKGLVGKYVGKMSVLNEQREADNQEKINLEEVLYSQVYRLDHNYSMPGFKKGFYSDQIAEAFDVYNEFYKTPTIKTTAGNGNDKAVVAAVKSLRSLTEGEEPEVGSEEWKNGRDLEQVIEKSMEEKGGIHRFGSSDTPEDLEPELRAAMADQIEDVLSLLDAEPSREAGN